MLLSGALTLPNVFDGDLICLMLLLADPTFSMLLFRYLLSSMFFCRENLAFVMLLSGDFFRVRLLARFDGTFIVESLSINIQSKSFVLHLLKHWKGKFKGWRRDEKG